MLFNSWVFAGFLAVVLPLYFVLPFRAQNLMLLAASYVFYGTWDLRFLGLLGVSTVVDYAIGIAIDSTEEDRRRRQWLAVSIFVNLGILGFFKYWNFFIDSAGTLIQTLGFEPHLPTLRVLLPVGISFYTFQSLGYTVDVYRRDTRACRNPLDYALYVAYFPQLVAGPIERATRLLPQLMRPRTVTADQIASGLQLMFWGYVKKVAIADSLAQQVDRIYQNPSAHHGFELWLGMYCFAIQVYADFSGYSDIARGVSRLLGVELMVNFRQPYLSRNVTEFWRRWHISLSTWLRDYIYVPLGGNRRGVVRQYMNLMTTMLVSGVWHGASWHFVIWGFMHGLWLSTHRIVTRGRKIVDTPPQTAREWGSYALGTFFTFHFVSGLLIWFRSSDISQAMTYTSGLFRLGSDIDWAAIAATGIIPTLLFYAAVWLLIDVPCWWRDKEVPFTQSDPWVLRAAGYAAAFFVLSFVRDGGNNAFVYFQF